MDRSVIWEQGEVPRRSFMDLGPRKAATFLTPEVFVEEPEIAEQALEVLKDVAWTNTIEKLDKAIESIRILGKSLSTDLFDANPVLAKKVLTIFRGGFDSNSVSVRIATIKEAYNIIVSSVDESTHRKSADILAPLLFEVCNAQEHNDLCVIDVANRVWSEIQEKFPKEDQSPYSKFEIDSLVQTILKTDVEEEAV